MKLEFEKIDVETSKNFAKESFGLGDPRVIQELLSSKIYSRPKYIIVQEVACNARDANREAGRADVPIEIKLPNRLDNNLIIADSGPGISPERMSNVFLLYGNSTKRSSDKLTGGFGIGAKTPFTYTDTFTIVTVTDDEDGRHKRTYIAYKADGGFAKMSLVSTEETDEETGTAICFAVENKDFNDFIGAARQIFKYWKVKPTIKGVPNWAWEDQKVVLSGPGWELEETSYSYGRKSSTTVLVDRIPYSVRLDSVFKNSPNHLHRRAFEELSLRLYFEVGDISVSATREDLDYTDKTIAAIKAVLDRVVKQLEKKAISVINGEPDLMSASIKWRNDRGAYKGFVKQPTWKGKRLFPSAWSPANYTVQTKGLKWYKGSARDINPERLAKITNFSKDASGAIKAHKRYGRITRQINFNKETVYVIDDIKKARPNRLRMLTLFEQNPSAKTLCVIEFADQANAEAYFRSEFEWDSIQTVLLSTVPKKKNAAKTRGAYTVNAVKMLKDDGNRNSWTLKWMPVSRNPEDTKGGIYVILKNGKPLNKDGTHTTNNKVEQAGNLLGKDVHGILYKYRNKISSSWQKLDDAVETEIVKLSVDKDVVAYQKFGTGNFGHKFGSEAEKEFKSAKLDDPRFAQVIADSKEAQAASSKYGRYKSLLSCVGKTPPKIGTSIRDTLDALNSDYPLLSHFDEMIRSYFWNGNQKKKAAAIKDFIFYINSKFNQANQGASNANP
jgi:histidine kinase/DNA gyrase B/HSP90-like ATPase